MRPYESHERGFICCAICESSLLAVAKALERAEFMPSEHYNSVQDDATSIEYIDGLYGYAMALPATLLKQKNWYEKHTAEHYRRQAGLEEIPIQRASSSKFYAPCGSTAWQDSGADLRRSGPIRTVGAR
jgi:hypothetical protein